MDKYLFDKRVIKKMLIKYAIIFLIMFPFLIIVNAGLGSGVPSNTIVIIDVVLMAVIIASIEYVLYRLKQKKIKSENKVVIKSGKLNDNDTIISNIQSKPKVNKTKITNIKTAKTKDTKNTKNTKQ